jgi:uncharacterized membrane protein HdeD (DUF308 family)
MADHKATLPTWARALAIVVGVISIGAAFIVVLFPGIAILTLVILLGVALLFIGIDRLIAGITGHPYYWMAMAPSTPSGSESKTAATPRSPP